MTPATAALAVPGAHPGAAATWRLALRFAWRELRGGVRGFGVFIACIALGVMAIAGVGSVAASLNDGISGAGRIILGGDLDFSLIQRQASDAERSFLESQGKVSIAATLRAMARTSDGRSSLVETKAVDDNYPLYGAVTTDPAAPLSELLAQNGGAFGAVVDPALLTRLDLKIGDKINIGAAVIALRAALISEPDKLSGSIGLGPRVLVSAAALQATGLLQPGSLVRWQYRLRLPDTNSSDDAVAAVQKAGRSEISRCRLGNPQPQQGFAAAGTQRRAFHPISHAGRLDHAAGRRRRRRQCGGKPSCPQARCDRHIESARRQRRRRFRHLLRRDHAGRARRHLPRRGARRGIAVYYRLGIRLAHSIAGNAGAVSGRAGARDHLWPVHGARLRAVAARARPRHLGLDAVSRSDRGGAALAARPLSVRHAGNRLPACGACDLHHL